MQRDMQSILHAEVGDMGGVGFWLLLEVGSKSLVYRAQAGHKNFIRQQLIRFIYTYIVENGDGIVVAIFPVGRVNGAEQLDGVFIPGPPEVVG